MLGIRLERGKKGEIEFLGSRRSHGPSKARADVNWQRAVFKLNDIRFEGETVQATRSGVQASLDFAGCLHGETKPKEKHEEKTSVRAETI